MLRAGLCDPDRIHPGVRTSLVCPLGRVVAFESFTFFWMTAIESSLLVTDSSKLHLKSTKYLDQPLEFSII
jgi:hypothetical protein